MKLPTKVSPLVIKAAEACYGVHYRTLGSPPVRVIMKGFAPSGEIVLDTWQANCQEWRTVKVPKDYKLQPLKEGEQMPTVIKKSVTKGKNSVKAKSVTGKTVYQEWGDAFKKFGTSASPIASIVKHMQTAFPGRKTDWPKWVNAVRTLYNRGDKRLGVPIPATPLKPYNSAAPKKVATFGAKVA